MRSSRGHLLLVVLVFIILETISVYAVYEKSIVQKSRMTYMADSFSSFVSDKWTGVLDWFSLKQTNSVLAQENAYLMQ
ncbi:MAG: hypothetical protein KBS57_00575, partial [Alistipes sp.]|nr:hypothetical protein [Candidatus Minthomonas equi]